MASTYQYTYTFKNISYSSLTLEEISAGEKSYISDIDIVVTSNDSNLPPYIQKIGNVLGQYGDSREIGQSEIEEKIKDQYKTFFIGDVVAFKDGVEYPKAGTPLNSEDNITSSPTDTIANTSDTPRYNYSDGTTITFGKFGPEKYAIIKYGTSFGEEDFEIIKGNTSEGQGSFSADFDILAEEQILGYNSARESYLLTPVTLVRIDPPTPPPPPVPFEYSIIGKVIDSITNEPLVNTKITTSGKEGQEVPNSTGDFTLTGTTTEENKITLTFNTNNYTTKTVTPYLGNGTIKEDIGIIELESNTKSIEDDKISSSQLSTEQVDKLNTDSGKIGGAVQKRLNDTVASLKNSFLPTVLLLISKFGVTGVPKLIEQGKKSIPDAQVLCPTEDTLLSLIKSKNNLVKKLNITYKTVDTTTKSIGLSEDTINILLGVFAGLDIAMLALPTSTGAPGIPGLTVGAVDKIVKKKDETEDDIDNLKSKITSLTPVLALIVSTLLQAISYLDLLDSLVQICAPDDDDDDDDDVFQDEILDELRQLSTEQSNQQSPIVTNINGFEMDIEVENTNNKLKRKRAIARNGAGVVMLKGDYSFSSIDQILIDQLVFYIQQNDLKAN